MNKTTQDIMVGIFQVRRVEYEHMTRYQVFLQVNNKEYKGQSSTIVAAMSDALRTMHADRRKK